MKKLLILLLFIPLLTACPQLQNAAGDAVEAAVNEVGKGDDGAQLFASSEVVSFDPGPALAKSTVLTIVGKAVTNNSAACTQDEDTPDAAECLLKDVLGLTSVDVQCLEPCIAWVSYYREGQDITKTFFVRY